MSWLAWRLGRTKRSGRLKEAEETRGQGNGHGAESGLWCNSAMARYDDSDACAYMKTHRRV